LASTGTRTPRWRAAVKGPYTHAGGLAGGATGHVELFSADGGNSWFEEGKDAQYRTCPETLRCAVLSDGCETWDTDNEIVLRDDGLLNTT